jgi:chromosome segregation ATPase
MVPEAKTGAKIGAGETGKMSDIVELERRITAALERIGTGIDALGHEPPAQADAGDNDGEIARLSEALAAEREANQQLEERVRVIRERKETTVAALEKEVASLREESMAHGADLGRIKRVNSQLRENNQALREANADGLSDPHLINKSMLAELEALRTRRETDRAEMDEILAELKPLIGADEGGAAHA